MKKFSIELLNTGTELLLGTVVNTNASWIGERLFECGLRLERQVTVPDGHSIFEAMREAAERSNLVLVTGGLGPTSDDVTREALAELCGVELKIDHDTLNGLKEYFALRQRTMSASNEKQAMVPQGARVLHNENGTAPGLWMPSSEASGRGQIILLPGPPRELRPMMEQYVLPELQHWNGSEGIRMKTVKMVGIGESDLQDLVDDRLNGINGLEVGYCARLGEVDVRLIGRDGVLDEGFRLLDQLAGEFMVQPLGSTLEEAVVARLKEKGWTLATAESCTGGLIAKRITDVSGASEVFHYGYVTYANEAKEHLLGVPTALLDQYGAVSEPVAKAMAEGALADSGADVAVAVTGIAGPTGGTETKPVGTVWMAWAFKNGQTLTRTARYPQGREAFRMLVSQTILAGLLKI